MKKYIFIRTLVLGPLFSATIFVLIGLLSHYFSGSKPGLGTSEVLGTLLITIIAAYLMVFIPSFGFLPGIIPLAAYSLLLTYFTGRVFCFLSKYNVTTRTKIVAIIVLSILIGIVIYGGFYLLALASGKSGRFEFIWIVVVPTSAIFGAWAGLTYARKLPN
ncbi:hypothetical protein K5Q02_07145 [Pseudomonas sp. MM211]|uniref:hypothetical protein n=1 Tax=Pseudomonas sp. MM211 TaxID=2866808 RepID=UPI001CEDB261|nr:hypothetical protein [Pseudomonas sp. MM211]UCJ18140.1 hypothetical protein K5Q02_07145 [Pseudomonas sp. MM211]